MAGSMQRGTHCVVHGFGSHVEMKTVEFMDKLECWQACSWCGLVCLEMYRLSCRHILCKLCLDKYKHPDAKYVVTCCEIGRAYSRIEAGHPGDKRIRCVYAGSGCDFVGPLQNLDEHLRDSCALYMAACHKCGGTFAHKDMRIHYPACAGRQGVFLRSSDARSALDNLSAACEKFETAVTSAGPDDRGPLRDTLTMVREQLTRIQGQLATGTPWQLRECDVSRLGK
ncbi:uncharacterized protein LOC125759377 [Rhipicephalus sanguineus]|uniref:uncharacterized protein LOC125759377 n=1 Tax=Rhipicephalus sanguineus TaxID=34632 RepID=UPI0020C2809B|nr:uncharacterized protein LOC125759377 [Rhipicephalus sanguineus]